MEKTDQKANITELKITEMLDERKYRVESSGRKGDLYSDSNSPYVHVIYDDERAGSRQPDGSIRTTMTFIPRSIFDQALAELNKSANIRKYPIVLRKYTIVPDPEAPAVPKQVLSAATEIPEVIDALQKYYRSSGDNDKEAFKIAKDCVKLIKVDGEPLYNDKAIDKLAERIVNAIKKGQLGVENGKVIEINKITTPTTPTFDAPSVPPQVLSAARVIPRAVEFAETTFRKYHRLPELYEKKTLQLIKDLLKSAVKDDGEPLYTDRTDIEKLAGQILNAVKDGQLRVENGKVIEIKKKIQKAPEKTLFDPELLKLVQCNYSKEKGENVIIKVDRPFESINKVIEDILHYAQKIMKPLQGNEPIQFSDPQNPSVPCGGGARQRLS